MADLSNKVAFITGGSSGIGAAIAKEIAACGAKVIISYRANKSAAELVLKEISEMEEESFSIQMDITDSASIKKAFKKIKSNVGVIDILINNAGINKPADFDMISEADWDKVLDTNLKGAFLVSQTFLPIIRNKGSVINIASVSGQYGGPRTTHYACSKAGLISLTQNLAIFCSKKKTGIRVNCVSPGLIESKMAGAAKGLGLDDKILMGRKGTPEEVAKAVAFLASDDASYITAQTINVNGGLYF